MRIIILRLITPRFFCLKNVTLLLCVVGLSSHVPGWADSPVWKVSKGQSYFYLGGTVHLLSEADYPLPKAMEDAYQASAVLVVETDLDALNEAPAQMAMLSLSLLPPGDSLAAVVRSDVYSRLLAFLESRQLPKEQFTQMTPFGLSLVLPLLELNRFGMTSDMGVDAHYYNRAKQLGKPVEVLESADEQFNALSSMSESDPNELIGSALDELASLQNQISFIVSAWKGGDVVELDRLLAAELREDFPDVYRALLVDRNNKWLPKIEAMIKTDQVELILVGALHLVGRDGLLHTLQASGYTVENM